MRTGKLLVVVSAAVIGLLSTAPGNAEWPKNHSMIFFDGDGFETECVDFAAGREVAMLYFSQRAVKMTVNVNPQDVARCDVAFELGDGSFGGVYRARNTYINCACNRRGTPRFQVSGMAPGEATCGCTATYWGMKLGKTIRTEPLLGVELAKGDTCAKAYRKPVLRPRLLDSWSQDPGPR